MKNRIAVLADTQGNAVTLSEYCTVDVYEREATCWAAIRQKAVSVRQSDTPDEVREKIKALVEAVGACRVIAGSNISGLAYNILNRMGFSIFEIEAVTSEVLSGIAEDVAAERIPDSSPVVPYPIESETPGEYWLDLIALQAANPEISSKKALKPFLETTPFARLELICSHLPPWLEQEQGLQIKVVDENGRVRAEITKACCR